jgi:hypothetical protein
MWKEPSKELQIGSISFPYLFLGLDMPNVLRIFRAQMFPA